MFIFNIQFDTRCGERGILIATYSQSIFARKKITVTLSSLDVSNIVYVFRVNRNDAEYFRYLQICHIHVTTQFWPS